MRLTQTLGRIAHAKRLRRPVMHAVHMCRHTVRQAVCNTPSAQRVTPASIVGRRSPNPMTLQISSV